MKQNEKIIAENKAKLNEAYSKLFEAEKSMNNHAEICDKLRTTAKVKQEAANRAQQLLNEFNEDKRSLKH